MWLFGRNTSAESDETLNDTTHAQKQRNKQIGWLRDKIKGQVLYYISYIIDRYRLTEVERDTRYRTSFVIRGQAITLEM